MWSLPLYKPSKLVITIRIVEFNCPHYWLQNIVSFLIFSSRGTCLTLMKQNFRFFSMCFWGEPHFLPFLKNVNFSLTLRLEEKAHASPLSNKILLDKLDKFYLTKIHCSGIKKKFKILLMIMIRIMIMSTKIVKMKIIMMMMTVVKMMMVMVTTDVRWEDVFF